MVLIVRHIFSAILDFIGRHWTTIATIEWILIFLFLSGILPRRRAKRREKLYEKSLQAKADIPATDEFTNKVLGKAFQTAVSEALRQKIKLALLGHGVRIYAWERECYKCHRMTTIYSYYLLHDLKESVKELEPYTGEDGLGYIPSLDKLVAEHFPAALIRQQYSRAEGESYFANHCSHCGCLQGRYYVVDDPDEICGDLWSDDGDMEQYLVATLPVPELIADEIADYIKLLSFER